MSTSYLIFVALLAVGLTLIALWAERYDKMHQTK